MKWPFVDARWRKRFALLPTHINNDVIWLEWYEWRHFPDQKPWMEKPWPKEYRQK